MLPLVVLVILAVCVVANIIEAIGERDWPRDTFRYTFFAAILALMAVAS
jgi:hypothetical protein